MHTVFRQMEFKGRIAGRFYTEFFFYLIVFAIFLYYSLQPNRNPWVVATGVFSGLLFVEMTYMLMVNSMNAEKCKVTLNKDEIIFTDEKGAEKIKWKDVELVEIVWRGKDKWLEALFGLDPSILVKKKREKEALGISPDYFDTQPILVEMQKLHEEKIFLMQPTNEYHAGE